MNTFPRLAALAAALAACPAFATDVPQYAVVVVPQSTDARVDHAKAVAINNAGEMAGTAYVKLKGSSDFTAYPARWATDGSVEVDFKDPGFESIAIDDRGDIVATEYLGGSDTSISAMWRRGAASLAPRQPATMAEGINDHAQYIGETYFADDEVTDATIYTKGVPTRLPSLGGGYSVGMDLNNVGDAVGFSIFDDQTTHAFYYHAGALTDLLLGTPGSACSINDAGQIAGAIYRNGNAYPFRWENGVMTRLGGGANDVGDIHINQRGEVIWSFVGHNTQTFVAPAGTAYSLNTLIVPGGELWWITEVSGLNDAGTIVAQARVGHHALQSVLLVPQ
jgi:uncharacterized membrane protein